MSDKFSNLPPELKVYILRFVDSQTIRQCVSLISKEFNKLSKDYTLYEVYEAARFDIKGEKLRAELDSEHYRLHLKRLSAGNDFGLDLEQFSKLEELTLITENKFCLIPRKIPSSIKSIRVHGRVSTSNFALLENVAPILKEVESVSIRKKEDLEKGFEIPADLHLIDANLFAVDEFLERFLTGELSEIQNQINVGVKITHCSIETARSNVLKHLAENVVEIYVELDCSKAEDRETLRVICRDCTSLKEFSLSISNIRGSGDVREVGCTQLQTLRLIQSDKDTVDDGEILLRFRLLIEATQHELQLVNFDKIPSALLDCFSDSLISLKVRFCKFSDEFLNVGSRATIKTLVLGWVDMSEEVMKRLLNPKITRLDIHSNKQNIEICLLISSLTVLEEVSFKDAGLVSVSEVLVALLPAKNTLRVFKYRSWEPVSEEDQCDILKLLQRFRRMQYVELDRFKGFKMEEMIRFFPSVIVRSTTYGGVGIYI